MILESSFPRNIDIVRKFGFKIKRKIFFLRSLANQGTFCFARITLMLIKH
jgi:hypothetical protein